jgi:YD repeat-containing protein
MTARHQHYAAGRLTTHVTRDARVESLTFDNDGHPLSTRQTRYQGSTGLDTTPAFLDHFDQAHTWNAFGDRTYALAAGHFGPKAMVPAVVWE